MRTKQRRWLVIGSTTILFLLIGAYLLGVALRFVIPVLVVSLLTMGAVAVWLRANAHATGHEWWQDDSASGWRG